MKFFKSGLVLVLVMNSSMLFSMEQKSSSTDSLTPVSPVGPVLPGDPVEPSEPPVNPTKKNWQTDSVNMGTSVDIDKTNISTEWQKSPSDITEVTNVTSGVVLVSKPLFSHRYIKPDGTGKCKFGETVGAWEKSPCARIYGSIPIVKTAKGTVVSSTGNIWSKAGSYSSKGPRDVTRVNNDEFETSGTGTTTTTTGTLTNTSSSTSNGSYTPTYLNRE